MSMTFYEVRRLSGLDPYMGSGLSAEEALRLYDEDPEHRRILRQEYGPSRRVDPEELRRMTEGAE